MLISPFLLNPGHYFFINANADGVVTGDRAVIDLPFPDQSRFRAGYAELSLAYHMYTSYGARDQMGTLSVYLDCGGERNITWFIDGNQGNTWKTVTIPLQCEGEPVEVNNDGQFVSWLKAENQGFEVEKSNVVKIKGFEV